MIRDSAVAIDAAQRQVRLAGGETLAYDRAIVSPGIDFMFDQIPALKSADAQNRILHAWKAGTQTVALRKQLESMRDGGVYVLQIPLAPTAARRTVQARLPGRGLLGGAEAQSKIVLLDSNPDIISKKGLFLAAWNGMYKGVIDSARTADRRRRCERHDGQAAVRGNVKGDVLNVVPHSVPPTLP